MTYLSFLYIDDNGNGLLNGDASLSFDLPKQWNVTDIEQSVLQACIEYDIDYISEETVHKAIVEAVKSYHERKQKPKKPSQEEEADTLTLTKKVLEKFVIRCTGLKEKLYIYKNGAYHEEDAVPAIKKYLEELDPNISTKQVNEVLGKICRLTYVNENQFDADPYMVNFENCWYNWLDDKTYPHTPDKLSREQLPYPYPEKKTLPKHFYKFMLEIHYPKEVKTAMEWMAYTFMKQNKFELACFKIGYGKNGKTTEDNMTRALHGGKRVNDQLIGGRVTGFSYKQIMESRWVGGKLRYSALNIDAETDDKAINMTEIKRLTSRDTQHEVESKGVDFQSVTLNTKFQMNFNHDPVITNQSDGDIRRLVMLSYPRQFEGKNEDTTLDEKLQSKEELSAIFSWVIAPSLRRLHKAKSIYMADRTIEQRRLRYELITDPLKAATSTIFLPEATTDDFVFKSDAYKAYVKFIDKNNLAVLSARKFGQYMKEPFKAQEGKRGPRDNQKEAWIGVRLNPAYTVMEGQTQLAEVP